jgi:hypothetical protein
MAQEVEQFPSKWEAPGFNPQYCSPLIPPQKKSLPVTNSQLGSLVRGSGTFVL